MNRTRLRSVAAMWLIDSTDSNIYRFSQSLNVATPLHICKNIPKAHALKLSRLLSLFKAHDVKVLPYFYTYWWHHIERLFQCRWSIQNNWESVFNTFQKRRINCDTTWRNSLFLIVLTSRNFSDPITIQYCATCNAAKDF